MKVTFRRLTDADLPQMHAWLNEPGVVRWWEDDDVSWEGVKKDYSPNPDDPAEHWIASVDGRGVGWIQCYPTAAYPDEAAVWRAAGADPPAGIDYLIGDPDSRSRGLGSEMIRTFVDEVVFGTHPAWAEIGAAPHVDNVASWRALEKAGFRFVAIVAEAHGPGRLMLAVRPTRPNM